MVGRRFKSLLWQLFALTFFVASTSFFGLPAKAAIPSTIGYQGILKNISGAYLQGTYSFKFRLYATSTGGVPVWTETQPLVDSTQGAFAVQLGSVTPFPSTLDFNQPLYISAEVNGDGEMNPRVPINSVPYAYTAGGVSSAPSAPALATGGRMYYDNLTGALNYYDEIAGTWTPLASSSSTIQGLQQITNVGNTTTKDIQFGGGTSTGAFQISNTLTVTGSTALQGLTFTDGTSTNWFGFATASGTTLNATNGTVNTLSVAGLSFLNGTSTSWLGFTTASGTALNALTVNALGLISPNVTISGGTIDGTAIGSTVSSTANFSNVTSTNLHVDGSLTGSGQDLTLARIGTSTYSTVQDLQNIFHSAGWVAGGAFTPAGGNNVTVGGGSGLIRTSNNAVAPVLYFDWATSTVTIPLGTTRYIGVEYNGGAPQVTSRTSSNWNYKTDFPLGRVVNEAGTLHLGSDVQGVGDHAANMILRDFETMPLERDERGGGIILGETGARNVTVSSGALWDRLNRYTIPSINTAGTSTFDRYYSDGTPTGFTKETAQTQWPNTQYDDGTGTLAPITAGNYAVLWFYIETNGDMAMLYGRNQYAALSTAETETTPAVVPDRISASGRLIGRLIFQASSGTAASINSVFDTSFIPTLVANHANLSNLDYDSSGHTGFAGTAVTNTFTGGNTFTYVTSTAVTSTDLFAVSGTMLTGSVTNLTVTGTTSLQGLSFLNGTSTAWLGFTTASGTTLNALAVNAIGLVSPSVTITGGTIDGTAIGSTVASTGVFTNVTSTNWLGFATASGTTLNVENATVGGLSLSSLSFLNGTSTAWLGFATASGTTLNALAVNAIGFVSPSVTITGGTIDGTAIGSTVASTGVFTNVTSTNWLGFATASGTTISFTDGTSTNWLGFSMASGTTLNALSSTFANATTTNLYSTNGTIVNLTTGGLGFTSGTGSSLFVNGGSSNWLNVSAFPAFAVSGGYSSFTRTETESNYSRPVGMSMTYIASPTTTLAGSTDFHGVDLLGYSASNNINNGRLYPFESTAEYAGSGGINELFGGYFQTANIGSGNVNRATNVRIQSQNQGTGNIYTSRGIYIADPVNLSSGAYGDNYGIYIDPMAVGTSSNYGVYSNTNGNFFSGLQVGVASSTLSAFSLTAGGNVGPSANNSYALGSGALSWSNVFASSTIYASTTQLSQGSGTSPSISFKKATGAAYGDLNSGFYYDNVQGAPAITENGTKLIQFGLAGLASTNIYTYTSLQPSTGDLYNLGIPNTAWHNIYASGTLFALNGSFTNATTTSWLGFATASGTTLNSLNSTFANATTTNFAVSGNLNSNLVPLTSNTFNLGSPALSWQNLYVSGTVATVSGSFTNVTSTNWLGFTTASGTTLSFLRATSTDWLGFTTASGTTLNSLNSTFANATTTNFAVSGNLNSNLVPMTNSVYDLGSSASSWQNIYASSTIFAGRVTTTNVSTTNLTVLNKSVFGGASGLGTAVVEIKGSSPLYALSLTGTVDGTTAFSVAGGSTNMLWTSRANYFDIQTNSSGKGLELVTNGGNLLLDSNGNVGIHTTNPSSSLDVIGNARINGIATTTNLAVTGNVNSNLVPLTNNAFDLGSPALSWQNIYASGTLATVSGLFTNVTSTNWLGFATASGTTLSFLRATSTEWFGFTTASGTTLNALDGTFANATSTNFAITGNINSNLIPLTNSVYDLGSPALSWQNIYASGTITGVNALFTSVTSTNATTTNLSVSNMFTVTGSNTSTFAGPVSSTRLFTSLGSALSPSFSSSFDQDTGFSVLGGGSMGFSSNGAYSMTLSSTVLNVRSIAQLGNSGVNDIGASGGAFRSIYVSSTAFLGGVTSTGNINPLTNSAYDLGSTTVAWRNIYVSSTAFLGGVTSTGNINPATNTTYDLGSPTLAWRDEYSSGTIYGVNETLTGTSTAGPYAFQDDAGAVTAMDMNVTTAAASEQAMAYEFDIDGNTFLQMYSRSNAAGGLQTTSTAINFFQPLLPSGNNLYDIGSVTNAIRSLYTSSTAFLGGVTSTGNVNPFTSNAYNLGGSGLAWANIYSSGTFYGTNVTTTGSVTLQNLTGPTVTDNLVCIDTSGLLTMQATNCTVSSARFKENIQSLTPSALLAEVMALRSVSFDFKAGHIPAGGTNGGGKASSGFIAEEVALIDPQLVSYTSDYTPADLAFEQANYPSVILVKNGVTLIPQTVDYARVTYVLTGAVQAQQGQLTAQQSSLTAQQAAIDAQQIDINALKATLASSTLPVTDIYASGTAYIGTDVKVNGVSVCLADGTNCPTALPNVQNASTSASVVLTPIDQEILAVTTTPNGVSSQVWIVANATVFNDVSSTVRNIQTSVRRGAVVCDGTVVGSPVASILSASGESDPATVSVVDSPATTTATGYHFCMNSDTGAPYTGAASMVAQEVKFGADVGEVYYTNDKTITPGEIVTVDPNLDAGVSRSGTAYDNAVLGVISTRPGLLLSERPKQGGTAVILALNGRVPVKASAMNGAIVPGDYLTTSPIPGTAMKAVKAGQVIGRALSSFDGSGVGTVMLFVNNTYYNGSNTAHAAGSEKDILTGLLAQTDMFGAVTSTSNLWLDRVAAAVSLTAPTVTTKSITVDTVQPLGTDLSVLLGLNGRVTIGQATSSATSSAIGMGIVFDSQGNGTFSGRITAQEIKSQTTDALSGRLDVLEIIVPSSTAHLAVAETRLGQMDQAFSELTNRFSVQIDKLGGVVSSTDEISARLQVLELSTASSSERQLSSTASSTLLGALDVQGLSTMNGGLHVDQIGAVGTQVIILSDVAFVGRPVFNADNGGFILIKQGYRAATVTFGQPFAEIPVVTMNLALTAPTSTDPAALSRADALNTLLLSNDIRYIVTDKSKTGFTLMLNADAPADVTFDWTAFSIKDPRTAQSVDAVPVATTVPAATPAPSLDLSTSTAPVVDTTSTATVPSVDTTTSTTTPAPAPDTNAPVTTPAPTPAPDQATVVLAPTLPLDLSAPSPAPEPTPAPVPDPAPAPAPDPAPAPAPDPAPAPTPTPTP